MASLRTLLGSSVPIQLLHSGTSFLVLFACARIAGGVQFGHISAYFLLLTIGVSLSMQWVSLIWLRDADGASAEVHRAASALSLLCAALFWAVWGVYGFVVFGLATFGGIALVGASATTFFAFFSTRRLLLLQGRLGIAARLDGLRTLTFAAGFVVLLLGSFELSFDFYLGLMLAAHALPLADLRYRSGLRGEAGPGAGAAHLMRRVFKLEPGDRLNLYSAAMNIVFSQASSICAPLFISAVGFASLRAYELLVFPTLFALQTLDPIYLNRFRRLAGRGEEGAALWLKELSIAALAVSAPFACLYVLLATPAWGQGLLDLLVAGRYHEDRALIHGLMLLTLLMACNGPARWALTVAGRGRPLLVGSMIGFPLSLTLLALVSQGHPQAWVALCAKLIYEACVLLTSVFALVAPLPVVRAEYD